ncbi:beta-galactosidase [Coraliomargarita sp. W4R53]
MRKPPRQRFSAYCLVAISLLGLSGPAFAVYKPTGTFSSSGAMTPEVYENPELRGVLIRAGWSTIEPAAGEFDFSQLDAQIEIVKKHGASWSLAIVGGATRSPAWLIDEAGAAYLETTFRGKSGYRLPLYWDPIVQKRLSILAQKLAEHYQDDEQLALVYVTQMTSNGIEGHLQGMNMATFIEAGYTDDKWVAASKQASYSFAQAFDNKAIAFEVHEINRSAVVPTRIINELWNDESLEQRVGAAMWWLSGKTTYQAELIAALTAFPGDIYGQVIGRSNQTRRFKDEDFSTVFEQAKQIGIRYIEPWEYEFRSTNSSAHSAWNETMADYNAWADATYLK